ncbi:MAG: Gx transporter family protein [Treponemataceae bacterium]
MRLPTLRLGKLNGQARDIVAVLGAFCLFLSTIEYMIPKPLPFMRMGIANLPIMLALDLLSPFSFFLLVAIKVVGQSLVSGSLFSYIFLFSLLGSFSSAALMFGLRKLFGPGLIGFLGIGCLGALMSNLTQILLARVFVFGESAKYVAPPFLAAGVVTGIALGLFCEAFVSKSTWYAARLEALKAEPR